MKYTKLLILSVMSSCCFLQINASADNLETSSTSSQKKYSKADIVNIINRSNKGAVDSIQQLDHIFLSGLYQNDLPVLLRPHGNKLASDGYIQSLKAKAAQGNAEAMLELGHIYIGEKHDIQAAMLWYIQASQKGEEAAFLSLARLFKNTGREASLEKILKKGAVLKFPWALNQYVLNKFTDDNPLPYLSIDSMPKLAQLKEHAALAKKGYVQAMLDLGLIYQYEKKDIPTAIGWYRKAAEKGNEAAIISLLNIYKDQGKSESNVFGKLLDKAAVLGYSWALGQLALYYLNIGADYLAKEPLQHLSFLGNDEATFLFNSIRNNREVSFPLATALDWFYNVGWKKRK